MHVAKEIPLAWCLCFHLWKKRGAKSWNMWSRISSLLMSNPLGPALTAAYIQYLPTHVSLLYLRYYICITIYALLYMHYYTFSCIDV